MDKELPKGDKDALVEWFRDAEGRKLHPESRSLLWRLLNDVSQDSSNHCFPQAKVSLCALYSLGVGSSWQGGFFS